MIAQLDREDLDFLAKEFPELELTTEEVDAVVAERDRIMALFRKLNDVALGDALPHIE